MSQPDGPAALVEAVRQGLERCAVASTDRLAVAVSGGVDSIALLHVLVEIGQPIVAVTIDHGLREGSGQDAAFVLRESAHLGVEAERVAVEVAEGNLQAQARDARYRALVAAAQRHDCWAVATGHTATDQAETVLMALVRGAGLRGLAGMPERRTLADGIYLVRPMLQVPRAELEQAAREQGWTWREESSNAAQDYRRNRLRHSVMPMLRQQGGAEVDARIAASAARARGALDVIAGQIPSSGRTISLAQFAPLSADARCALLAEAVVRWAPSAGRSSAMIERLGQLVEGSVGACVASGGVTVWRERDGLRFDTNRSAPNSGVLTVTPLAAIPDSFHLGDGAEVVDLDRAGEVTVRLWQDGDRIRPLGLDGSVLVSDLLRDRGVPRADRGGVPVVVRGGHVLWVVGHRLAASVAVTAQTVRAGKWAWHPSEGSG